MFHKNKKIAVLLWLFHTDLWDEFYSKLYPLNEYIHLYLGIDPTRPNAASIANQANEKFSNINIKYYPNAGGDILPFLNQISDLSNDKHDIFLKLHSKKSKLFNYMNWRVVLLESLIGSQKKFLKNIQQFDQNETGCVCNKSLLLNNQEHTNTEHIQKLCNILDIDYHNCQNKSFAAGSMFFGKISLFQKYFNPHTLLELSHLLQNEVGHVIDNTEGRYCHALERIFGYLVLANNLKFKFCIEEKIKILNKLAPNKKLHIIKLYNEYCYAEEDPHVYGRILKDVGDHMIIEWHHINPNPIAKYKKINKNSMIRTI
jgi:lipopolysaccharide biosynthesis protein